MAPESSIKRLVAKKARISEILEGEYIQTEGWEPSYVLTKEGRRISRVNIICTVISADDAGKNYTIDDGTGSIGLQVFGEAAAMPPKIEIGDIVLVIGKVRQFNGQMYLNPEIVKIMNDLKWLQVRQLEMEIIASEMRHASIFGRDDQNTMISEDGLPDLPGNDEHTAEEKKDSYPESAELDDDADDLSPAGRILNAIKELDKGDGALPDEVEEKARVIGAEKIIEKMIMEGEIFKIKQGRLKVLQ